MTNKSINDGTGLMSGMGFFQRCKKQCVSNQHKDIVTTSSIFDSWLEVLLFPPPLRGRSGGGLGKL